MTGLPDSAPGRTPTGMSVWSGTVALAKACLEVSKHQREFQRRGSKRHKGRSGAAAAPQPPGVDVHADLFVNGTSYGILRDALQSGAAGPLRLKCRELQVEELSAAGIAALLESLDPAFLRRVDLRFNNLGLTGLSVILPHLSRFPQLRSLKLQYSNVDVRRPTPESAIGIRCLAGQLGMLPSLRELNLGSSRLSGNLRQILCDLRAPLESLELSFCSLLPADLAFLSQRVSPWLRSSGIRHSTRPPGAVGKFGIVLLLAAPRRPRLPLPELPRRVPQTLGPERPRLLPGAAGAAAAAPGGDLGLAAAPGSHGMPHGRRPTGRAAADAAPLPPPALPGPLRQLPVHRRAQGSAAPNRGAAGSPIGRLSLPGRSRPTGDVRLEFRRIIGSRGCFG
ncbi:leucine-rich repeat-containing protein 14 isoform X1 [Taeniopygia guttata]|uniref:leucine-rich repeat-containing protein 14 isoform X1 n=1 Tax=Taeniopygia guttata TaxID=59729 RepID=UPI003BB98635